jgi:hypothetical protein
MKSKRRSSDSKKRTNNSINNSNGTPTPDTMLYENSLTYSKYKEYERYIAIKNK